MNTRFFLAITFLLIGAGCVTNRPIDVIDDDSSNLIYEDVIGATNYGNIDDKANLIHVDEPDMNDIVASPLTISGEARGTWFFEASFPIELQDAEGNVIAQTHAEATSNWMTEEFVPFTATLTFTAPAGVTEGVLYFRKDNPSGLPEHEDALYFPIQLN